MIKEFQKEYRFLSNFWPCKVTFEGEEYPSVEHAYQAAKNPSMKEEIRKVEKPGAAKRLGRQGKLRPNWEEIKYKIMYDLVKQKFTCNQGLKIKLLITGEQELQEGNNWGDVYWGVDLRTGEGENNLGKILMLIRGELKRSDEA